MKFVADFETTTDPEDTRVWAFGLYNIENDLFEHGKSIDDFFKIFFRLPDQANIYFHNLKFDGEFIFYYLFRNGFTHVNEKNLKHKQFRTLITHMGVFYAITIMYKGREYTIYDSLKIIPLPVKGISKAFGLKQIKGDIDYNKPRPVGYTPTKEEVDYIRNDVEIVGKALLYFFDQNLKKITQASNAFSDFKKTIGNKKFDKFFPVMKHDKEIRQAYKGGFTWVNPKYQGQVIEEGIVYDVNSLYPSVMYDKMLPYGEPIYFKEQYEPDPVYSLSVQMFSCNFELKKDHIPTIQMKHNMFFKPTEYISSSEGVDVMLCLTSVDLKLFMDHYDVYNVEWLGGWKFKATNVIFKEYVDKWVEIKIKATVENNPGLRTLAKLMLNALYGKFGINPKIQSKIPRFDGEMVRYDQGEEEEREPIYIPVAAFITAYSRDITIRAAQKNYDRFIYADTDSIHLKGYHEPDNIDIHETKLGAWKLEGKFTRGKFIRAKTYIEEMDGEIHVACAGLPKGCHHLINFDNFKDGLIIPGKLQHKRVKGGVILKEIDFTIKM